VQSSIGPTAVVHPNHHYSLPEEATAAAAGVTAPVSTLVVAGVIVAGPILAVEVAMPVPVEFAAVVAAAQTVAEHMAAASTHSVGAFVAVVTTPHGYKPGAS
jgi:hypothetical protein